MIGLLLADYGVVSEVPALAFTEDLFSAYLEAKVILVERDIDKWFKSFDNAVISVMWCKWGHVIADLDHSFVGQFQDVHMRWVKGWMGVEAEEEMWVEAKDKYCEHYKFMRRIMPRERFLEYELSSGWKPLCNFPEKEVPDVEFPKVNETESMHGKTSIIAV